MKSKTGMPLKPKYDERQKEARGKAYQIAFCTMFCYLLVWGGLAAGGVVWWNTAFGALLAAVLGATAFAAVCILRGAYAAVGANKAVIIAAMNITCAGIAVWSIGGIPEGGLLVNGIASLRAIGLAYTAMCVVLNLCFILRGGMERKARRQAEPPEGAPRED